MRPGFMVALAAMLALMAAPALAQTPGTTMPVGTQNPAMAQPQLVAPPPPVQLGEPYRQSYQPGPQPGETRPGPTPDSPSAGELIVPGGAGGLCECLVNHEGSVWDKTKIHRSCLVSVGACQAACNSDRFFSFVPRAIYSCPGHPEEPGAGHIVMNTRPMSRLLAAR